MLNLSLLKYENFNIKKWSLKNCQAKFIKIIIIIIIIIIKVLNKFMGSKICPLKKKKMIRC